MVMHSSSSPQPSAAEVLRARYASRLPASLEKLAGPRHGVVELPLHVAWSGLRAYDLDRPRLRMGLYRTVLGEGQADRGAVRDLIDVHAASRHRTIRELERLGERHGRDEFRLHDLRDRLAGADWADDEEFYAYGLTEGGTAELRAWAQHWVSELEQRLHDHDGEA
ncbi:hypothetical protein ACFQ8S_31575 [Streptomyces virginiae]|uniref:hypothetical protein n=1 Tax=Streptomyces virginiae TaxID=1961 RepID=UPI0036AEFE06